MSAALSPPPRKNPRKNISAALGAAKSEHPDLGTYDPEVYVSGN